MKYHLGFWHHLEKDQPVWMMSEVDELQNVLRQIDRFWDGTSLIRSAQAQGMPSLLEVPFEEEMLSDEDGEFSHFYLTKEEFERIWISTAASTE